MKIYHLSQIGPWNHLGFFESSFDGMLTVTCLTDDEEIKTEKNSR